MPLTGSPVEMQDIPTFALMMKDEDSQEDKGQAELDDRNQEHQEWNNNRAKGTQKEQEENVESTPFTFSRGVCTLHKIKGTRRETTTKKWMKKKYWYGFLTKRR